MAKLLLDSGDDGNKFSHDKPLHYAAENGHIDVAKILLARGAHIDPKGMSGQTQLSTAVSHRQAEMAGYLLSQGGNVNARANYGRNALNSSCENDDVNIGQVLLRHGADVTWECNGKRAPWSFIDRLHNAN